MNNLHQKRYSTMVSIIVLTYNQEQTIRRTLDSIFNQKTKVPYEIIIGDDASSDGTRVICEEYKERYPDIVKINEYRSNLGVVKNYAEALSRCQGEFIMECAGDDWWHNENKIDIQVNYMKEHPDCVVCHGGFREYYVSTDSYIDKRPIKITGDPFTFILKCNPVCAPTVCIRKSALDSMNFQNVVDNGFMVEDYPTWLGISQFGEICDMDFSLATYSIYSGSIHNINDYQKRCRYIDDFNRMRVYYATEVKRKDELDSLIDDIYLTQKGETAIKFGVRKDALKAYRKIHNRDKKVRIKTIICMVPVLFKILSRRYNKGL